MESIRDILERNFNKGEERDIILPEDFYYKSEVHLLNYCKKVIKGKSIIPVEAIEPTLSMATDHIFNFSVKHLNDIDKRRLKYPCEVYSYTINKARNQEELMVALRLVKRIISDYNNMFDMEKSQIENSDFEVYIDYKKNTEWYKKNYINDDIKNRHINFEVIKEVLTPIHKKIGVYKIFDKNEELIFIGKSSNLAERILYKLKESKGSYFSFVVLNNEIDAEIYSIYYVSKLKPLLNSSAKTEVTTTLILDDLYFTEPTYIY